MKWAILWQSGNIFVLAFQSRMKRSEDSESWQILTPKFHFWSTMPATVKKKKEKMVEKRVFGVTFEKM